MSDFDKEAERQKLREKFDRDKEKRKETERMSQLLLQGATMTNRHCDTCGDPLFRYQGQVFCATCQGRAQETEAEAQAANATQEAQQSQPDAETAGQETPSAESNVETRATADGEASALDADAAGNPAPHSDEPDTAEGRRQADTDATASATEHANANATSGARTPTSVPAQTDGERGGPRERSADGIATARASLIRTLTHHARQAEAADGPRRATEHLSAAREAAEALAALEGSR